VSQLRTSIGLNTGPCIVGNLGSRTRFNYTMMGDNVNLAARLNFAGGSWGANAACTEATRVACQQHGGDRVIFRPLGRVSVKGRPLPVPIHEIVGLKESIETSTRECIGLFELGLARYYSRDWDGAISQFQQSARLEPLHPDRMPGVRTTPSLVFLGYCQQFKSAPPPDEWNGVFVVDPR
jgi:adenylate cyclase